MKYIRTKDGIYKNEPLEKHIGKGRSKGFEIVFKEQDIIKQADTIEELCDEFVEVGNHKPFLSEVRFEHWDKQTKNILIKQGTEVYGAIWTKHGLNYVAKMNKKGDLELL